MSDPDLETRIRSYYDRFAPDDSGPLVAAAQVRLEEARRPRPTRIIWGSLRLAATLAAAAVLLAVLVLPRSGPAAVPGSGTGSAPAGSPGPTFDAQTAMSAAIDKAGLMRSGGIWAVQGQYLLTSTDNGKTWRAGSVPDQTGTIWVLDPDHAWVIDSSQSSAAGSGQLVVYRTSDGGATWRQTPVSRDFPCDTVTPSFVDASNGFVMCSVRSSSPDGPVTAATTTTGSGTVLRTADGGASWTVAGGAVGLGSGFAASDATTLWSAPDPYSSQLSGAALNVSRDAGTTWSRVDLPELPPPFQPNTAVEIAAGPVFWDASNGAMAVGAYFNGSGTPPAVWFYRTSDAGRSWTLVKQPTQNPMMGMEFPEALAGREWAAIWLDGFDGMTTSSDFGASWTRIPWSGLPPNSPPLWIDYADKDHAAATIFAEPGRYALMLSSDGGRTWQPADFGDARTKVSADPARDEVTAESAAEDFSVMAVKGPSTAWSMLSTYSQQAFGSEPAFEAAEAAINKATNYQAQVGGATQDTATLSESKLGAALWTDLTASAEMSRAYAVVVTFSGTSEKPETLVVAPLAATGEWRVWLATMP
jgi:photosystem II stability/assembly factor-like uncharacterized protein